LFHVRVAEALARLGDAQAVKICIDSVDDDFTSDNASRDLAAMGPCVIEPLAQALLSEDGRSVWIAADALAGIHDAKSREAIRRMMPLLPPAARVKAAEAWVPGGETWIWKLSEDPAGIDVVVEILKNWPEREIRYRSIKFLVLCKAGQSVPALREIARTDPRHTVRRAATKAAEALTAEAAGGTMGRE
jgi:HEAT repeat protein